MSKNLTYENIIEIGLIEFPELKSKFGSSTVEKVLLQGPYILYEDLIVPIVVDNRMEDPFLERTAGYLEQMLISEDSRVRNLGELALLEGFVINDLHEISPWLLDASKVALSRIHDRIDFDFESWMRAEKSN